MGEPKAGAERRRWGRALGGSSVRLGWLAAIVLGSVLALGSQHVWALLALAVGATLLLALSLSELGRIPAFGWLLTGLIAYTLLQLVPLPHGVVAQLSPAAAEVWAMAARVLKEPVPRFVPLSVDPQATALEALKWWIYLATFLSAVALRRSRGSIALGRVLFVAAAAVALITLLHGVFDWQRVYGLYQPSFATERWQRGPLLNANNLAAYLNLGLGVGAGLLASGRTSLPRWLLILGVLGMAAVVLLSGSRGGLSAMVLAGAGFCAALVGSSGLSERTRRFTLGALGLALVAAVLALALSGDRLLLAWFGRDLERKLAAWRWTVDLIRDYVWFGVGRGAYETSFPRYRGHLDHDWTSVFAHPENLPLQWLAEWGIPVGGAGLLVLGGLLGRLLWGSRRARLRLGLAVGCSALLLQNMVDLSSEIAGVMVALMVAVAALGGTAESLVPHGARARGRLVLVGLAGALLIGLGASRGRAPAREERARLAAAYHALDPADQAALGSFRSALAAAIRRHPADPYLPLLGGLVAHRAGDQNPVAWLGHALRLGPTTGTVHLTLADVLSARGARGQAILHLRLASQYDATLRGAVVARAARWARDADELERAFPEGRAGVEQLTLACPRLGSVEHELECWRRVVRRSPGELSPLEALAEKLAAAIRTKQVPCTEPAVACRDEVARIVADLAAKKRASWRVQAVALELASDAAAKRQALRDLLEQCPGGLGGADCLRRAIELARTAGDSGGLELSLARFLAVSCAGDAECADAHDVAASEYARLGARALALKHRQAAARAWPSVARWLAVAEAALRAKTLPAAQVALHRAESFGELDEAERAELVRLRYELRHVAQDAAD